MGINPTPLNDTFSGLFNEFTQKQRIDRKQVFRFADVERINRDFWTENQATLAKRNLLLENLYAEKANDYNELEKKADKMKVALIVTTLWALIVTTHFILAKG